MNTLSARRSYPDALVSARNAGATVHHVVIGHQVLEVVTACTVGVDACDVERVTRTGRDVVDRHGQLTGPAPFVIRVASDLRAATDETSRARTIVSGMVVVRGDRAWNRPQAWSTRSWPTRSGARVPPIVACTVCTGDKVSST